LEVKNGELWMYQEEQQQQQLQVPQDLLKRPHVAQFNNKYAVSWFDDQCLDADNI
jgi:hypothetical protein